MYANNHELEFGSCWRISGWWTFLGDSLWALIFFTWWSKYLSVSWIIGKHVYSYGDNWNVEIKIDSIGCEFQRGINMRIEQFLLYNPLGICKMTHFKTGPWKKNSRGERKEERERYLRVIGRVFYYKNIIDGLVIFRAKNKCTCRSIMMMTIMAWVTVSSQR